MNVSVEPCHDFYEYACGNYGNVKPEVRSSFYDINKITRDLVGMTDLAETLNVSVEFEVAQRFYNTCLEANLYPFHANDPAFLELIRSIGGFPAVDGAAWNASNFSWFNMSAHMLNYGATGLYREELSPQHPFEASLGTSWLGFDAIANLKAVESASSHAFRVNEERMRGYLRSFELPEDRINNVIKGVFTFWLEAAAILGVGQYDTDFDVTNYFEIAWNKSNRTSVNNFYLVEMDKVCARHPEAAANYLAMKLLYTFDARLEASQNNNDYCTTKLRDSMPFLFDKLYLAVHFREEKSREISEIVEELRKSLRALGNVDWLRSESRQKILLKESSLSSHVGSIEDKKLTDRLVREYRRLEIVKDNYAATIINLQRLKVEIDRYSTRHSGELPSNTKPQELLLAMQELAAYNPIDNSINILAGILHPPLYHQSWPISMKFGALGSIVGHELAHSVHTLSWFGVRCFVDFYSDYLVPEIDRYINGEASVEENIADNAGLQLAVAAYRSYRNESLEDQRMPGIDLLPEQLFFLAFAQHYCSDYKEENYWMKLNSEHTIPKYRVLGSLSNNKDFFKAFNCAEGRGMRPYGGTCSSW
ncbi:neprilysin-2-like [Drosophila takahashii]|uniref:neprilysin-2-like n=1 Tax=Drosophila takahashii TaxID=29030 RepID=UPI001CF8DB3B|nr:neprilysin-2-like [Drosophila takahashii]